MVESVLVAGLAVAGDLAWWVVDEGFYDVRVTDWPVLHLLEAGPLGMCALAMPLGITQQAASKAISSLEARGYVARTRPEDDRRRHDAALLGRGRALLECERVWGRACQERAVQRWGSSEVRRACAILGELAQAAERMPGQGRSLRPTPR